MTPHETKARELVDENFPELYGYGQSKLRLANAIASALQEAHAQGAAEMRARCLAEVEMCEPVLDEFKTCDPMLMGKAVVQAAGDAIRALALPGEEGGGA